MRTSVRSWMVLSALLIPGCTLVFNQDRRWTGGDAEVPDASVPDAPGLDAPGLDAPGDAAFPPDASRPLPDPTARTLSLVCPGMGQVTYADPSTGDRGIEALDAAFSALGTWSGFAMLGNNVEIVNAPENAIPSHAIWLEPGPVPHVTWLRSLGEGLFDVGWDRGIGTRSYTPAGDMAFEPFVLANAAQFMVGGGSNLRVCMNDAAGGGCSTWDTDVRQKWGGFASGARSIRVLAESANTVSFPDSTMSAATFPNPSGDRLRQSTGSESSALYSNDSLFVFGGGNPYTVNQVMLPSPLRTRVSYDGSNYQAASISNTFGVTVSPCTAAGCGAGAAVTIDLPAEEQLRDWNFHAMTDNVRIAVLLTGIASGRGTHVWVAVWHSGVTGMVTPLRIASGRGLSSGYGEGRSVESVAQFNGSQLDVYVSALVALFSSSDTSLGDRIYLSGFRVCI